MYGYTRVSTMKQGKGVSLIEQKSDIEQYAQKQDIRIIEWFSEKKTAAKVGRPEFKRMLQLLRRRNAAGVIFHKIDRSTRNYYDWADIVALQEDGAEIHFAADNINLKDRTSQTAADIHAVMATAYIRNLRDESIKGQRGRLNQGIWPYTAPLGYNDEGKGKVKSVDKHKAPIIKKAFELYATGEYSLESITAKLHEMGLRNSVGKRLYKNATNIILRNPFYAGDMYVRATGRMFQGKHTPLISRMLFQKVQDVLDGKNHLIKSKHNYTYRRQLSCGNCHLALVGERQKGRVYYRCHRRNCETKTIREDVINDYWYSILENISLPRMISNIIEVEFENAMKESQKQESSDRKTIQLQIDKLRNTHTRLTDAYLEGVVDKGEYLERKKQYKLKHELQVDNLEKMKNGQYRAEARRKLELLKSLAASYKKASTEKKRELLRIITSNREIIGRTPVFKLKDSYYRLLEQNVVLDCAHHRDDFRTICGQCTMRKRKIINQKKYARDIAHTISKYSADATI